jgi:hypothetical protein
MEQNMMMVGIAAVIVIVAIAAVMMMGNGGQEDIETAPTSDIGEDTGSADTGAETNGTAASDGSETADGGEGTTEGDAPESDESPVVPAGVNFGTPTECIATVTTDGETDTYHYLVEGSKMKVMGETAQGKLTVISPDGKTYYLKDPSSEQWMKITDLDQYGVYNPNDLEASYQDTDSTAALDCNNVPDIPDSEFQLPPDAEVLDLNAMMEGMEGMEDFDYNM